MVSQSAQVLRKHLMPQTHRTVPLREFKGLNNIDRPQRTDPKYLKEIENLDVSDRGALEKRYGFVKLFDGSFHSLWSDGNKNAYMIKAGVATPGMDGEIVRMLANEQLQQTGIAVSGAVAFDTEGQNVYFTSNDRTGVFDSSGVFRNWGLEIPNPSPNIQVGAGLLPEGDYQVAITYVDSFGRESGADAAHLVTIGNNQAILLSGFPVPTDSAIVAINIYCSPQNGSRMYLIRSIPIGTAQYPIHDVFGVYPIKTDDVYPAPTGHLVRYAHSRMWVASGNVLYFSDAMSYDWFHLGMNAYQFEARIRAIMPVQDGVWVAADKLYYLQGREAEKMSRSIKENAVAVEGTDVAISGGYLALDNTPAGLKWLITTDLGVFALYDDGLSINLTSRNVEYPKADHGTAAFVRKGGRRMYLSILKKLGVSTTTAAVGDQVTATIIKNGVRVQE